MRVREYVRLASAVFAVFVVLSAAVGVALVGQTASQGGTSPRTPWGEPDLQGIWTEEFDILLERPERYGNRELLTDEEYAEIDEGRAAALNSQQQADGDRRNEPGSERDVAGAYSDAFLSFKHMGRRTSLIVDPPNGRIPPLTEEAQARAAAEREFRLELLRSTETCRSELPQCAGGVYDPTPSPRRAELPPRYNTSRMNRHDNPEDGAFGIGASPGRFPSSARRSAAAFAASCRRRAASPCSTTSVKARVSSGTSS